MADTGTGAQPLDQNALVTDIDRTRADLARTIDAISDRVSPSKNIQRARAQASKNMQRARAQASKDIQRARDQASKDIQRARDQASKDIQRAVGQVRQRVSQIDPMMAGAAAAALVLGATALLLWRHHKG